MHVQGLDDSQYELVRGLNASFGPWLFLLNSRASLRGIALRLAQVDLDDDIGHLDHGGIGTAPELVEQPIHPGGVERTNVLVADLDERGAITCVQAFDLFEGEHPVGRGFAMADAELCFEMLPKRVGPADLAGEAGADFDFVLTGDVRGVIHAVERGNAFDFGIAPLEPVGDLGDRFPAQESAILPLSDPEPREDAGFPVRVVGLQGLQFSDGSVAEPEVQVLGSRRLGPLVHSPDLQKFTHEIEFTADPSRMRPCVGLE